MRLVYAGSVIISNAMFQRVKKMGNGTPEVFREVQSSEFRVQSSRSSTVRVMESWRTSQLGSTGATIRAASWGSWTRVQGSEGRIAASVRLYLCYVGVEVLLLDVQ